jgi:nitrate reductase delta subunit
MSRHTYTLRALAFLLRYPDARMRAHLEEVGAALRTEAALAPTRLAEIDRLIERLAVLDPLQVEGDYVDTFDRGRRTSLHLFEHVHGDSRDRGPAMVDLAQTYERTGLLLAPDELPDYLPVVLEFASTQPAKQARAFLGETAHIVRAVFSALVDRPSPYASVLAAVLEMAGERVERVDLPAEPALDDAWAEPAAFDGCSSQGQSRPDQPQPIQIVRRRATPAATTGA